MSEVKRYGYLGIVEEEDGEVVKWEDYVALKADRDALAAENGALKAAVIEVSKSAEDCEFNGDEQRYVVMPDAFDALTDLLDETPATDAYLKSMQADAISSALDASSSHCDTDCVMDAYDCSYEIAEMRSAGAIDLHDGLVAYSAQLRAGKDGE